MDRGLRQGEMRCDGGESAEDERGDWFMRADGWEGGIARCDGWSDWTRVVWPRSGDVGLFCASFSATEISRLLPA